VNTGTPVRCRLLDDRKQFDQMPAREGERGALIALNPRARQEPPHAPAFPQRKGLPNPSEYRQRPSRIALLVPR
jgi:hypothetical protein